MPRNVPERFDSAALLGAIQRRTLDVGTRVAMLEQLVAAAEYRDDRTSRHTERVGAMAGRLAAALGLPDDEAQLLSQAAKLHDVGKIGIPDSLLLKPAPLTAEEMTVMRAHTVLGGHILSGTDVPLLQLAERIALSHHEWWDGSGYPYGLKGDEIPLCGRIVAVADAFDAVTNDRPYRRAQGVSEGLGEIVAHAGRQFDPQIVEALAQILRQMDLTAL